MTVVYDRRIPQIIPYHFQPASSPVLDYQISLSCPDRTHWLSHQGTDPPHLHGRKSGNPLRSRFPRPCAHSNFHGPFNLGQPSGQVSEGQDIQEAADGISGTRQKILGPASLGQRLLRCFRRQRDGQDDPGIH